MRLSDPVEGGLRSRRSRQELSWRVVGLPLTRSVKACSGNQYQGSGCTLDGSRQWHGSWRAGTPLLACTRSLPGPQGAKERHVAEDRLVARPVAHVGLTASVSAMKWTARTAILMTLAVFHIVAFWGIHLTGVVAVGWSGSISRDPASAIQDHWASSRLGPVGTRIAWSARRGPRPQALSRSDRDPLVSEASSPFRHVDPGIRQSGTASKEPSVESWGPSYSGYPLDRSSLKEQPGIPAQEFQIRGVGEHHWSVP